MKLYLPELSVLKTQAKSQKVLMTLRCQGGFDLFLFIPNLNCCEFQNASHVLVDSRAFAFRN